MGIEEAHCCGLTWQREHPQLHTFPKTALQSFSWGAVSGLGKC